MIAYELENFGEISFCMTGQLVIGYEINNLKRYCIKYTDQFVLGAYELTFNKKSAYLYRATSFIDGFFVRKGNWINLIQEYPNVGNCLKRNILLNYLLRVRIKINVHRERAMQMHKIKSDC